VHYRYLIPGILLSLDLAIIFAQIADLTGTKRISFASQFAHNLAIYDSQNPIRLLSQGHIMRDQDERLVYFFI
jgi:hypothetical protein